MVNERAGFVRGACVEVVPEYRYKCLRECCFGEESPQQVGESERHKKCIRIQPGAEGAGNYGIAHESENSRHQGQTTDGPQGLEQIHYRMVWKPECAGLYPSHTV